MFSVSSIAAWYVLLMVCVESFLHYQNCCSPAEGENLLECLVQKAHYYHDYSNCHSLQVVLLTSFTANIQSYAQYAIGINANYAAFRQYKFKVINESSYVDRSALDADARWNKVLFLKNELRMIQHHCRSDPHERYVVWLDADLAVVDHGLDILEIIASNGDAHIIMSKDKKSAPYVGNTGSIIVRVSDWSAEFLDLWWNSYDRSKCCEQNALTWLFERNWPLDVKQKIKFLPADVINTDFPFWQNHNSESRVLHLAGLTNLLRVSIFEKGFREICKVLSPQLRQSQLGLNREYLRNVVGKLPNMRLNSLQSLLEFLQSHSPSLDLERIRTVRLEVFDILKQDDNDAELGLCNIETAECKTDNDMKVAEISFYIRVLIYENFKHYIINNNYVSFENTISKKLINECIDDNQRVQCEMVVDMLKDFVSSGFEFVIAAAVAGDKSNWKVVLQELQLTIELVLQSTQLIDSVQAAFLYYQFKCYVLQVSYEDSELSKVMVLKSAVSTWLEMTQKYQYYGSKYVLADPDKEYVETLLDLGTRQCQLHLYDDGLRSLEDAIKSQESMIRGYDSILIATSGTINYANIALAELFFNYGVCLMEASKYEKALHAVMQSKQLILPFGAETKMLGDRVKLLEEILTSRLYMSIPSIDMVKHNQDHKQVRKMKKIRKKNR